jgi:SAM-dependent methyltransferase
LIPSAPAPLGEEQRDRLALLLRNEADIAFRRRVRLVLEALEARPGDRILDCGCGMGFLLRTLTQLFPVHAVGVDLRASSLARARREVGGAAGLVQTRLPDLPFRDGSFDRVTMTEVLEHLGDDVGALRAVGRLLRPGGRLVVTVPHRDYPFWWDPLNKALERVAGRHVSKDIWWLAGIWADHVRLYGADELADRLAAAGFRVRAVVPYTHYCLPFHHFLVYGLGKNLLERNLLPANLASAADRFRGEESHPSPLNPIRLALRMVDAIDRRNDGLEDETLSYVGLVAWADRREGNEG